MVIKNTCSVVPQPFSLRLFHAKYRWMGTSEAPTVHFQRIPPQARPNGNFLERITRGGKSGVRLQHLGDGEQCKKH